jgi:tetratricopeptide (TPR) repeat protein
MLRVILALIGALGMVAPAQAKWREASSEHFVIYSDQSESLLRDFAEMLESYHSALEFMTSVKTPAISPSNRVTIYVVGNNRSIRRLYGNPSSNIAGFYISRAGASAAFVPRLKSGRRGALSFSETILLHEYAHHFMYSNYQVAFPLWLSEGFAEFYAAAGFGRDGSVTIGRAATHRAYELLNMREIPIELLLDTEAYTKHNNKGRSDSFYGNSWLLFHYLTIAEFDPEAQRAGQLRQYQLNLFKGRGALEAARNAFGDLETLDKDTDQYLRQGKIMAFELPPKVIAVGPITIRNMTDAAGEAMETRIQSRRGVDTEKAAEILPGIRTIGAKYPDDPFVQATLAEAEYDAGNDALAIAAADRALAQDAGNMSAHVQKIYALFRTAENGKMENDEANWEALLKAIVAANRAENNHPIPLIYFYRSFAARGKPATELAVDGLERALQLAPYDVNLRLNVAQQQVRDGRYSHARNTLSHLLLDPHNTGIADVARQLLDQVAGQEDRSLSEEEPQDDLNNDQEDAA